MGEHTINTVHTVHGVLKARILKWFASPSSSGPHSVRPLHHDLPILDGPTRHGLVTLSQTRLWSNHCRWWLWSNHCSHEIKRRLLLGRKVMTNLDSIFKSRDITLPTKVHLVQAMVFPVVMYGCESWTVKKAEH